jgi:nucleotide-binding universal stress UspA family protein
MQQHDNGREGMKALCAVDGSNCSIRGIEALGNLFRHVLREIILVHVMDTSFLDPVLKKEGTQSRKTQKILTTLEEEGRRILQSSQIHITRVLSQRKEGPSVRVRAILAKGHAAYTIVKQAEKRKPSIIILGSRGFLDIQQYILGSVSRKVLSHAPCPVLIVKDPIHTPARVVLAVDGSNASKRAANYLNSWISPDLVSVHVLSVIPKLGSRGKSQPYATALRDALQKQAQETTAQIRSRFLKKKFKVTTEVIPGNPRAAILDSLVNREANLAVLGAKGLTGPERFQMGSVSEWVAAYSGCSILVVRQ